MTHEISKNKIAIFSCIFLSFLQTSCLENRQYIKQIKADFRANRSGFEQIPIIMHQLAAQGDTIDHISLEQDTISLLYFGKEVNKYTMSNGILVSIDKKSVIKDERILYLSSFLYQNKITSIFDAKRDMLPDEIGLLLEPYFPVIYMCRICDTCHYPNSMLQYFSEFDDGAASWVYMLDSLWYLQCIRHF